MPAFTPEQEVRIAEIVRAAIAEERRQLVSSITGETERCAGKQLDQAAPESSRWTWDQLGQVPGIVDPSPLTVTIAGGRIVLDAPEIVATSTIRLEPPRTP